MIKHNSRLRVFPIFDYLRSYNSEKMRADMRAGINVALLDIPQGMAYALLAGFPLTFGIYASAIACLIGPLLASSRFVILGPTNATAVLVLSTFMALELTGAEKMAALPVLLCMVGLFLILGAFAKVATFIRFVSMTVNTSYITAAALLIIVNQLDTLLGLPSVHARTFFEVLSENISQISTFRPDAILMVVTTVTFYFGLKRYIPRAPTIASLLILCSATALTLNHFGLEIALLEPMPIGSWPFAIPDFSFERISELGGSALAIAFLALLESASIAKTLAAKSGERVNLNQHMLSMGAANIGSAFASGIAVSGSLTRSTLNFNSGARTPIASIFSGLILVLAALTVGPIIGYIPQASLATVVVLVGFSLISRKQISIFLFSTKADALVFAVTFISGLLFPLNVAIYFGAAVSIMLFLQHISEPKLVEYAFTSTGKLAEKRNGFKEIDPEVSIVHLDGELFFASTEIFTDQMRLICQAEHLKVIILKIRKANRLDATSALTIAELITFAKEQDRTILICGANAQVQRVLRDSNVMGLLGEENFFPYTPYNPNQCTSYALKRAQEILGTDKANIVLYTNEDEKKEEEEPSTP